ncbi:MAG: septum site-determining protein MinC [bacterium]
MLKKPPSTVEIKGIGNDVNIILNNDASFSEIESELTKKLRNSKKFFSGINVVLDIGGRILNSDEVESLRKILNERFDLRVSFVRGQSNETLEIFKEIGWDTKTLVESKKGNEVIDEVKIDSIERKSDYDTILIKRTIRSGQTVKHNGNVVVIGDVNAGAEVEAGGDIIIFGKLRGMAHAGLGGNKEAKIIALELSPIQLRIAGHISRSPDDEIKSDRGPEVAKLKDGNIIIEKLKKQEGEL